MNAAVLNQPNTVPMKRPFTTFADLERRTEPSMNLFTYGLKAAIGYCFALSLVSSHAQGTWPDRPIRFITTQSAGGNSDTAARLYGIELSKRLGQPISIENKPGANGMIATADASKAAPDGYTFLVVLPTYVLVRHLYQKRPYNDSDLTAVAILGQYPQVLMASSALPFTSLPGLMGFTKRPQNENGVTYASGGEGSMGHLMVERLAQKIGGKFTHVPYKGSSTSRTDLMANRINIMFDAAPAMMPHIKAGKINALAVTSKTRVTSLPDVPTLTELGYPDLTAYTWLALLAPAKTPKAIQDRIAYEIQEINNLPSFRAALAKINIDPVDATPEQASAYVNKEDRQWKAVIEKANIRLDNR